MFLQEDGGASMPVSKYRDYLKLTHCTSIQGFQVWGGYLGKSHPFFCGNNNYGSRPIVHFLFNPDM